METLAYLHISTVNTEAENLIPSINELNFFEGLNWKLPSSAWIRIMSVVLAVSIVSTATNALALGTYLQRGSRGTQVVALQNSLKTTGYFPRTIRSTGFYGSITVNAVRRFQQARGLQVDGIAGARTLSALGIGSNSSSVSTTSVLQRGSRGSTVTQLQNRLKTLGFFKGPITGYYGQLTQDAVSRFQQARQLRVDGVAGSSTLSALQSSSTVVSNPPFAGEPAFASTPPTSTPLQPVQPGTTGAAVSQLQTRLRDLGFYKGAINGAYGPLTETAVRDFQRSRGLAVNGIAGATTVAALNRGASGGSNGSVTLASLQRGSRGSRVRSLQARLIALGYYTGAKDGIFGLNTETAVRRFQQDRGLVATGIADTNTFAALAPQIQTASL